MIREMEARFFKVLNGRWQFASGVNCVRGANGSGKSSLEEAIVWCLTGRDKTGSLATEHLEASEAEPMVVKLVMMNGTTLERRQRRGQKSLRANAVDVTQAHLEKSLPVGWQTLLAIFCVGYFERLDEKTKRGVFTAILPKVERQAILEDMVLAAGQTVDWAELVVDWTLAPAKLAEAWRLKARAAASCVDKLAGRREQLAASLGELGERGEVVGCAAASLAVAACEAEVAGHLEAAREWERWQAAAERVAAKNELAARAGEHNAKLSRLRGELASLRQQIAAANAELARLGKERGPQAPTLALEAGSCPTCGQTVDEPIIAQRVAELAEAHQRGQRLAAAIDYQQAERSRLCAEEQQRVGALAALGSQIDAQPAAIPPEPPHVDEFALLDAQQRLEAARLELSGLERERAAQLALKEQATRLAVELARVEATLSVERDALARLAAVSECLHPVRGVEQTALARQIDPVNAALASHGMHIKMRDVLKNGEAIDCFELYSGGQPLSLRSDGERLAAGCVVSELLASLSGSKIKMLYVPNCTLIDGGRPAYLPATMQVFLEQTTAGALAVGGET